MDDLLIALAMIAAACVPGVGLYFLTDGAMWAAVLSSVLAVPFGLVGAAMAITVDEAWSKRATPEER